MHRFRTALLTSAALAALIPSLAFALDSEGGDGGHDPGEGSSTPAPQEPTGGGVVYDDMDDSDVSVIDSDPLQGQPQIKVKLPGLCKLLGC